MGNKVIKGRGESTPKFSRKLVLSIIVSALLVLFSCCIGTVGSGKRLLNWISFEIAWSLVNNSYFDPEFGGVDWEEIHDRYRWRALLASDSDYYNLVNQMLWELNVSHLVMVPPGIWQFVEPTVFAEGTIGVDVRLLDGEAVITAVDVGSPGEKAGLRPGLIIKRLDGVTIDDIAREAQFYMEPPYNDRHRTEHITSDEILSLIYGLPGVEVAIAYSDERGEVHEVHITRESRSGKTTIAMGLPDTFIDFEARRLDNGIGYMRFNWFHPALAQKIPDAINSMEGAPGLIIDLRGNPGGMREVAITAAEHLVEQRTRCSTLTRRAGFSEIVLEPTEGGYSGPVVVIIDVMSKSSSEFFAACTQAIERAVIVGERSPGSVGPAEMMLLPNGATFLFPTAQERTLDGTLLEGQGVVPDIEVDLDRTLLLKGVDSQLEAAIQTIEQEKKR